MALPSETKPFERMFLTQTIMTTFHILSNITATFPVGRENSIKMPSHMFVGGRMGTYKTQETVMKCDWPESQSLRVETLTMTIIKLHGHREKKYLKLLSLPRRSGQESRII